MKDKDIQQLTDRYLAGETSNEEERRLALALHEIQTSRGELPEDWRAVQLMLGELTLGEALYDDIMTRRGAASLAQNASAPSVRLATERQKSSRRLWRWAAAAVIALAAGIGVALYQPETSQPKAASALTNRTSEHNQRYIPPRPALQVATTNSINEAGQPHEPMRKNASAKANRRKRKSAQPKITPSGTEMTSPTLEERTEEPLLAAAEAEQQTEIDQYPSLSNDDNPYAAVVAEMRDIRSRGERLQRMLDEIINDKTMLANHLN
ncbi:MAG: hypothetical protein IJ699_03575 [Bacteroidaceae bacterium]|nr:hypothetical protein [Bacteroidaceae bacterium]